MNIIVCIKQVPATNEVNIDPITHTIIRDNNEAIINPFDTYAIEEAVRIKERQGANITALSMGIPATETQLKEAIALGVDQAYLLTDRKFAGADTWATSYTLSKGIQKIGAYDLILCGKMATDGDTAQVGPSLGKMLGIPYITNVSQILELRPGYLRCRKMTDDGYEELEVQLPALLTVTKEINMPRLPSIKGLKKAEQADVTVLTMTDIEGEESYFGLNGSPTQVRKTFVPQTAISSVAIEGDVNSQVSQLLDILKSKSYI